MKLETDDPIKSKLLSQSERYREGIEEEAREITDRTEKIIKNALIIGGSLALAYYTFKQFSGSQKPKKVKLKKVKPATAFVDAEEEEEEPSAASKLLTQIGTTLASQASVFLLALAKEKLTEYLQAQAEKKEHERS
jgi:hypothetical protein